MEALLRELVEISSWTYDREGVNACSALLKAAMPVHHEAISSSKYGDHSVYHAGRPASDGGVILIGHIDTVFPKEKFAGYRSDGKTARGPGVLDMKGGLVVIAYALQALKQVGALDEMALSCVVVTEEEIGSPESAPHIRALAQGAAASLVFESGRKGDAIITRRKGTGSFTARVTGRSAHAGNAHQEGANAIWAVSRFVDRIQSLTDYGLGTTVNVGKISGGIGKNTVPDHAEAWVDLRFVSQAEAEKIQERILKAARESEIPGTRIEIEWGPGRSPMEKTPATDALLALYAQCQHQSGLGSQECALVGGGSDAATTAAIGIPSIDGLGPRGAGFHTLEEHVELDSLVPKAQALVRYLLGR